MSPIEPLDLAKSSHTYAQAMAEINRAVEGFATTGIAEVHDPDLSHLDKNDWTARRHYWRKNRQTVSCSYHVKSFIKKIAKELGRPTIVAHHDGWCGPRVVVTIKQLKRNESIIAPFLLFDIGDNNHWNVDLDNPIMLAKDKTNYYVYFNGPKGIKAYKKWAEQCRTDEAFRKAMKLDIPHNPEK